jgi:predicted transcriptional regulator
MQNNTTNLKDKILHFLYFNKQCLLEDLENHIKSLSDKKNIYIPSTWINQLQNEKLIHLKGKYFDLTHEGQLVVENYHSYADYKAS